MDLPLVIIYKAPLMQNGALKEDFTISDQQWGSWGGGGVESDNVGLWRNLEETRDGWHLSEKG